jgi:hypothetical protein
MGKPEGKRQLGRTWHKWEDNVKVDLKETGLEVVGLIDISQNRNNCRAVVKMVMKIYVAQNKGNLLSE